MEKKVCLPAEAFEKFLSDPLQDVPCVVENKDLMCQDKEGVYHCLLVTGEGRRDGVLVEAEGYDYARYASYVPDAAALEYDSLSEFGAGLSRLADRMILEGTSDTGDRNWVFYLDQIQEGCDFSFSENPALTELLADMLVERPEVSLASIRSDCLELRFYPDFCKNLQEGQRQSLAGRVSQEKDSGDNMSQENGGQAMGTCLKELLCARWENLHLVHDEIDYGLPHTIVELDGGNTDGGRKGSLGGCAGRKSGAGVPGLFRPADGAVRREGQLAGCSRVQRIFMPESEKRRQFRGVLQKEIEYWTEMCLSEGGEVWMARGKEKVQTGFYIEKEVLELADNLLPAANVRSRNEFVTKALKLYCGYLNSKKAENYLLQSLSSVLTSTVQDTENRLARMDFKIAVELSMLAHMIAYHSESRIDESAFRKVLAKCVEDVKSLNGAVELGVAYKYQKREN